MPDSKIEVVVNDRAGHAESPLWAPAEGALYWIDTRFTRIYRLEIESGKRDMWEAPARLGAIGLRRGGLIVATKDGVWFLDTATGGFEPVVDPEANLPNSRINDAKTDRAGRFWFGSQEDYGKTATGCVYRLDKDRTVATVDRGYLNPNGFAWSPDNRRMYAADTKKRTLYAYDFDYATGSATNRRTFMEIPANEGSPDGTTVDSQGYVWSANNGGGRIVRYAPDGGIDHVVELPVTHVTNMAFGGADLRTIYITTAWASLTQEEFWSQPLAGAVLSVRADVPGIPEPVFAG